MSQQNLKAFLKHPKDKSTVSVLIVRSVNEDAYLVADNSAHAILQVSPSFSASRKLLQQGTYVRILFPQAGDNKDIVLNEKSKLFPTKFFKTIKISEDHINDVAPRPCHQTLKDVAGMQPNSTVKSIQLKILKKLHERKVNQSTVTQFIVKDVEGTKNRLSIWNNLVNSVEVDKVYVCGSLRVEKFPTDGRPRYLSTFVHSSFKEEGDPRFDCISLADVKIGGICLGANNFLHYTSCGSCRKKVSPVATKCSNCGNFVVGGNQCKDFKFDLEITTEGEESVSVSVFRKTLETCMNVQENWTEQDLEASISDEFCGKLVSADVCIQEDSAQSKVAQALIIQEEKSV